MFSAYRAIVLPNFSPDTFDPPRYNSFTDVAKLYCIEALTYVHMLLFPAPPEMLIIILQLCSQILQIW